MDELIVFEAGAYLLKLDFLVKDNIQLLLLSFLIRLTGTKGYITLHCLIKSFPLLTLTLFRYQFHGSIHQRRQVALSLPFSYCKVFEEKLRKGGLDPLYYALAVQVQYRAKQLLRAVFDKLIR